MEQLHFAIRIKAPKQKVWDTMLGNETYRQWTSAFSPGSHYEGGWEQGSKIVFLGPDPQTGEEAGMVSRIKENRPHEFISIEHQGIVHNGVEDTESAEAKKWVPAHENYTFRQRNGGTEVLVDTDTVDELAGEFEEAWPRALRDLKALSEK